jgi:NADPH2:quinone reductase
VDGHSSRMRAVICNTFGPVGDLALADFPSPSIAPGHVLIDVAVAGVNFADGLIVQGKHIVKPQLPYVPGIEAGGVIVAIGSDVSGFTSGDRVITQAGHGAFGERLLGRAESTFHVPADLDLTVAAAGFIAYGTSYYALKDKAQLRAGETLLVLGAAGGVGLAAVELGKLMGARVIAAASSQGKLDLARRYGADVTINYRDDNLREVLRAHTGSAGVDVVFDPVGGPYAEAAARSLGWSGRYLVIGFAAGDIPKLPINLFLVKNADLLGVLWGAALKSEPLLHAANIRDLMTWMSSDKINPCITKRYTLNDAIIALEYVMSRQVLGKVVVTIP